MDIKNNSLKDQEKTLITKTLSYIKDQYFKTVFLLLKEEQISLYMSILFSLIQFFQLFSFCFHSVNYQLWNADEIARALEKFFHFFFISTYMKETTWDAYIILFYTLFILVLLVFTNIVYVGFAFDNKLHFTWNLQFLKIFFLLFQTILYLPMIEYFVSIMNCTDGYHSYFPQQECWSGTHIVHCIISVLITGFFTNLVCIIQLTMFEGRSTSAENDANTKSSGQSNFDLCIFQLILVVTFTFLGSSQFIYITLGIIIGGAIIIYQKFHYNSPFYMQTIATLWDLLSGINLWTSALLTLAQLIEKNFVEGIIIVWIVGLPFLTMILLTQRDYKIDILLQNINKYANGEDLMFQVTYLLKLIRLYKTNQTLATILDGYIEVHKQQCNRDDCPLKYTNQPKLERIVKTIIQNREDQHILDKHARLLVLVYQMYQQGTKKFPNNTNLRISFAYFLIEIVKYKQSALQELNSAEANSPPFDIQFTIFRLKQYLEEEIQKERKQKKDGTTGGAGPGADQLDIISEMKYQNIYQLLYLHIEQSALSYMEFWSQLAEDTPDMQKLYESGKKIYRSTLQVEEDWKKLYYICDRRSKPIILYAKYLVEIVHNDERGQQLLEKANQLTHHHTKGGGKGGAIQSNDAQESLDVEDIESIPTLTISGESEKLGIITQISLGASSLFGYSKNELINRKVNVLMSQMYSNKHDEFLENFLNTQVIQFFDQDRYFFGKSKSGYIFPLFLKVKTHESLIHGLQLIGYFKTDRNYKNSVIFITDSQGNIDGVSSSCISIMGIDYKYLQQKNNQIEEIFQKILFERENYMNKQGQILKHMIPNDSGNYLKNQSIELRCTISELRLSKGDFLGYLVKADKVMMHIPINQFLKKIPTSAMVFKYNQYDKHIYADYQQVQVNDSQSQSQDPMNNSLLIETSSFGQQGITEDQLKLQQQLKMQQVLQQHNLQIPNSNQYNINVNNLNNTSPDKQSLLYQKVEQTIIKEQPGEEDASENEESKEPNNYKINASRQSKSNMSINNASNNNGEEVSQKKDYAKGIKTMRYMNGKLIDVDLLDKSEDSKEEEEDMEQSLFANNFAEDNAMDIKMSHNFNDIMKSRKKLNALITKEIVPIAIVNLTRVVQFLFLILLVISFVEYFVVINEFKDISESVNVINSSNRRMADLQAVLANIRDLKLINMGLYTYDNEDQKLFYVTELRNQIIQYLKEIDDINSYLQLNSLELLPEHKDLQNKGIQVQFINPSSNMRLAQTQQSKINIAKYILVDITEQIVSKANQVQAQPLKDFVKGDQNIYFIEYNLLNEYYQILTLDNDYYVLELEDRALSKAELFFLLMILSPVFIFLAMLILIPVLILVNKASGEVIELFLEMSVKTVQQLYAQSECFIAQLRSDDDDAVDVQDVQKQDDGEEGEFGLIKVRRKKKYINKVDNKTHFILIKLLMAVLILEAYFIFNYFSGNSLLNNVKILVDELNSTCYSEGFYAFVDNAQRMMLMDESFLVYQGSAKDANLKNINKLYLLDSEVLQQHSQNIERHTENYKNAFMNVMTLNPCPLFVEKNVVQSENICKQFADGSVYQGMSVALTRQFENIRQILTLFEQIEQGIDVFKSIQEVDPNFNLSNVSDDIKKNGKINLMNTQQSKEVRSMHKMFIKASFRYLIEQFQNSMNNQIDEQKTERFLLFLIFIAMIFIMYYLFWLPMVQTLTRIIWKTRSLLTIIPLPIIIQMKGIRIYLRFLFETITKQKIKEEQEETTKLNFEENKK